MSELLARRARQVIAVDNSEKIVAFGADKAKNNGVRNLEFRLGDLENPPLEPASVDLVIMSQSLHHAEHPENAIRSAYRILPPGKRTHDLSNRCLAIPSPCAFLSLNGDFGHAFVNAA